MHTLPFHPGDSNFNQANAVYLAHASKIAYQRWPAATAQRQLGLRTLPFQSKLARMRGFLGVCDTHAVLVFRGSDPMTLPNWIADVTVKLVSCPDYDGRVHLGFSTVLQRTWQKIEPMVDAVGDKPLYLTGHSLGGALAVLAACRLAKLGRPALATYTYGAPRVGDRAFCASYQQPTYRVVNRRDVVPQLPIASAKRLLPPRPRFTNEKFLGQLKKVAARVPCYGHVAMPVYLGPDGAITLGAEAPAWDADALALALSTRGRQFVEGVTDHLISNYIRGLNGAVAIKGPVRARMGSR